MLFDFNQLFVYSLTSFISLFIFMIFLLYSVSWDSSGIFVLLKHLIGLVSFHGNLLSGFSTLFVFYQCDLGLWISFVGCVSDMKFQPTIWFSFWFSQLLWLVVF